MRSAHAKVALAVAAVPAAALVAAVATPARPASAHGTMSDPPSRVFVCKQEGPENPQSDACKAAVAVAGTQPFYDWNEVSRLDAAGRSRQIIPDGQLCSAGRAKYRGLDLQRPDWPAKAVRPGPLTVTYYATAPHQDSNFDFFITRDGWDPTQPLRWADLVSLASFTHQNPSTYTQWTLNLPQRTGRQLIYSIWQRVVGSDEAFYTCSDVDFGGSTTPTPPPTTPPTTPPPTTPPTTPPPTTPPTQQPGGTWTAGTTYAQGDQVTYGGVTYTCLQGHTAIAGWEPPNAPALWRSA
ncbi:lytic polysaccharide monooxygenase auxiliary activity family 9 protein [Actinomadura harenae]|uniref:Chitin-binding protein n=1 Tax=Actinomadura harenae TaxID=2483351 RepID=A0A3M2LN53_9ACTN|nr:lytic polysaccharide monooxygenase [Actinomadura harenae]RMI37963.1 chitin-binding protein [Actinomadura harenae]